MTISFPGLAGRWFPERPIEAARTPPTAVRAATAHRGGVEDREGGQQFTGPLSLSHRRERRAEAGTCRENAFHSKTQREDAKTPRRRGPGVGWVERSAAHRDARH